VAGGRVGRVSVVSVRGLAPGDPSVVYVGRACAGWPGSPLGNPFRLSRSVGRARSIRCYRSWLWASVVQPALAGRPLPAWEASVWAALRALAVRVAAGESVVLGCWCAPLPCHGDVVAACVRWLVSSGEVA